MSPRSQISSQFFADLVDSVIVDVASECHRITRLGLDRKFEDEEEEVRSSFQACGRVADNSNNGETNGKYVADIFGQTHPPVANEIIECMNCGRPIAAGKFAPHLEKCMGKARKARPKATRSSTAAQTRRCRTPAYSNTSTIDRVTNGVSGVPTEEGPNVTAED